MKVKIIIAGVIAVFIIAWLATNVKSVNEKDYSINNFEELCIQEEEIFTGVLAQESYDASRRWAQTHDSLLDLSNLHDDYTHKIRERYDINPVLYSDILARLQGGQLNCE